MNKRLSIRLPKITKNRYEILFFNKESMCNILSKSEKINTKNYSDKNNKNQEFNISKQDAENMARNIEKINEKNIKNTKNTKKCEINFFDCYF
jgi:K+/H+ antiporter YhaU regulatory subunit KhtT